MRITKKGNLTGGGAELCGRFLYHPAPAENEQYTYTF